MLLPHLAARCAYIKPSTLASLLRDPGSLVPRLISLRQLLPGADIGQVAAAEPELLLLRDLEALRVRPPPCVCPAPRSPRHSCTGGARPCPCSASQLLFPPGAVHHSNP